MQYGLQLFSLIDIMNGEDGLRRVLKIAAEDGYDGVEFAGFYGLSTEEVVEELKKTGLKTAGVHLGWDELSFENLEKNPALVIDILHKIGAESATVASYGGESYEDWKNFGKRIDGLGAICRSEGIRLGYHNHRHEFLQYDGEYALDILLANCKEENVFWELDPRHIAVAGIDPVIFAKKYEGRSPYMHVRDTVPTGNDNGKDTAAGEGQVDLKAVVAASGHHDWLIFEEGPGPENVADVKKSAAYLRANFN